MNPVALAGEGETEGVEAAVYHRGSDRKLKEVVDAAVKAWHFDICF